MEKLDIMEEKLINYINTNNLVLVDNIDGKLNKFGKTANKEKNRIKIVMDEQQNIYCIMFCEKNTITKFSYNTLDKILNVNSSWYLLKNNYIGTHMNNTIIYLHQYLMDLYGQGKGTTSIDHINRDKLDNRIENLRYANPSLQNSNMDKKQRQKNAQKLPDGITQSMIPKYVYYATQFVNKGTDKEYIRDFFVIEKHPKSDKKCIYSSKSMKVSIIDKLNEVCNIIQQLEQNEEIKPKKTLPKYIYTKLSKRTKGKLEINYERKINGKKESMKKTINDTENPHDYLEEFGEKIFEKYGFNPMTQS